MSPNVNKFIEIIRRADAVKQANPESTVAIEISQSLASDPDISKEMDLDGSSAGSHGRYAQYSVTVVPDLTVYSYNSSGERTAH